MRVFVTVGSTHFDSLIEAVLASETLQELSNKGYRELVIQCGSSQLDLVSKTPHDWSSPIDIHVWQFKPSLKEDIEKADLIISHAGSGTILEVLRTPKPLIVVANPTLLHNHQQDLAHALHDLGHLRAASTKTLAATVRDLKLETLVPFPPFDGTKFQHILDQTMGYL